MPPWSLHHLTIAFMASPISLLRPGDAVKPASSPYSTVIAVSVTPWSVAPLASPLPHGDARSPNLPDVAASLAVVVVSLALLSRLLPHAAASIPPTKRTHNSRSHDRRITQTPCVNARRSARRLPPRTDVSDRRGCRPDADGTGRYAPMLRRSTTERRLFGTRRRRLPVWSATSSDTAWIARSCNRCS